MCELFCRTDFEFKKAEGIGQLILDELDDKFEEVSKFLAI